jgi:hypothetical protein
MGEFQIGDLRFQNENRCGSRGSLGSRLKDSLRGPYRLDISGWLNLKFEI